LRVQSDAVTIIGDDPAGAFYGRQTLKQLSRQFPQGIPCMEIEDWPDFPARGYMQDISRDKVPTMPTLFALIDQLAELKYNQLQLYTEHTFAYAGHEEVWREASPITAQEIRALDQYCKERFIELVPNQNSFGHLERWFKHKKYEPLAETVDEFAFPWGTKHVGGFSLNPTDPKSLEFLDDLFDQLLPNFSSRMFNVGCDETHDVGQGKSKEEVAKRGKERVYLDFLLKVYQRVKARGHVMQFWGDIILKNPELIPELPKDLIALNWAYDWDHPFEKETKAFHDANVPFYVCPGTSSWLSISGRTDNAIANLHSAAKWGLANGAIGYLNTDWGDLGHLQYLPISYLPIVAGAAYAWCLESNRAIDLPAALDIHVLRDRRGIMGKLLFDLGNVYQAVKTPMGNSSRLFWILAGDETRKKLYEMITPAEFDDAESRINAAMVGLGRAEMDRPDAQVIRGEIANAAAMLRHACHRGRWKLGAENVAPADLAEELEVIISEHGRLWLERNRPGGLNDSARRLEDRLADYQ